MARLFIMHDCAVFEVLGFWKQVTFLRRKKPPETTFTNTQRVFDMFWKSDHLIHSREFQHVQGSCTIGIIEKRLYSGSIENPLLKRVLLQAGRDSNIWGSSSIIGNSEKRTYRDFAVFAKGCRPIDKTMRTIIPSAPAGLEPCATCKINPLHHY